MAVGYNARFGDPEAQNAMMMLSLETDIASLMFACTQGKLRDISLSIQPGFACSVVISSPGYPHNYAFGQGVTLDSMLEDVQLFHDSTRRDHGVVKTSGARVFTVTAHADTLENARRNAYKGVSAVQFRGMFYRRDIASICGDRPTFIKEREEDPGVVEDDVSATETGVCQAQEFV